MKFKAGQADERVVVCLWSNEAPPPGAYNKHIDRFSIAAAQLNWLSPFLRVSNMITFDFAEEDEEVYWNFIYCTDQTLKKAAYSMAELRENGGKNSPQKQKTRRNNIDPLFIYLFIYLFTY